MDKKAAIAFAPIIVIALVFGAYLNYSIPPSSVIAVGSVNLSSSWHYLGNITLSGAQSSCEIMRLPCVLNPSNTAMEFRSGVSIAYVETITVNNVEYTIVLINGNPYCTSPKTLVLPECPSIIEATSIFEGATTSHTNATSGLELNLSINSTLYNSGQGVLVNISEFNTLPRINNVSIAKEWPIPGLTFGPCGSLYFPFIAAIFQGYYTSSNISSATQLNVFPPILYSCPATPDVQYYSFKPMSANASIYVNVRNYTSVQCCVALVGNHHPITSSLNFASYWDKLGNEHNLIAGVYTVAGEDEWGNILILHFLVGA